MARQFTRLADIQYVASSAGAVYTNAASTTTYIKSFVLFNSGATSQIVKLYNVPDSTGSVGAASAANQFAEVQIVAKETFMLDLPYPITITDENDTIQAVTDTGSQVTIQLLGDKDA
jgi:hypothetical protein